MGYITNIIIVLDGVRPGGAENVAAKLKQWFYEVEDSANTEFELIQTDGKGSKAFSPSLLVGGFNYANVGGLMTFLRSIDWHSDDNVSSVEVLHNTETDWYTYTRIYSCGLPVE